ncbi:MAG: hypothetical protein H8E26_02410 [FCB group bacterium]|nr:hypothetical protein [FCB group bacterium]MBL7027385.1 hypothetical protein [Candidatus Neomarinimicrobiota bacterium]MBL7122664.1 hypothetical protein [Candidatus Neomarinimicrobiota bacterium]
MKRIFIISVVVSIAWAVPINQPTDVSIGFNDLMSGIVKMELSYSDSITLKETDYLITLANIIPFHAPTRKFGIRKFLSIGMNKRWPFYYQPSNCKRFYGLGLRLYYAEIDPEITELGRFMRFLDIDKSAWTFITLEPEVGRKWIINDRFVVLLALGGGPIIFKAKNGEQFDWELPPMSLHFTFNLGFKL